MKILIAPDSFKASLSASQVCKTIAQAIVDTDPFIQVDCLPLADGGEGTLEALCSSMQLQVEQHWVTGPRGVPVLASLGFSKDRKLAIFEMASASGLPLLAPIDRNPMLATSFGTGELMVHALDAGVERIILGLGGSATNDGGAGMLQALGFKLQDHLGANLPLGAQYLLHLHSIDKTGAHPSLKKLSLKIATDVVNPLLGPKGATQVYAPQKGATSDMLPILERCLAQFADRTEQSFERSFRDKPGAGAAGGMGFGLMTCLDAELQSGFELIADCVGLRERLRKEKYDWIVTDEGRIDEQSQQGKLLSGIGKLGLEFQIPVIAFTGSIADLARESNLPGIRHIFPIAAGPCTLAEAMQNAETFLYHAVQRVVRLIVQSSHK